MTVTGGGDGFHRSSTLQRVYAFGWTGGAPLSGSTDSAAQKVQLCSDLAWATPFGTGCQGTNGRVPALGYTNTPKLGAVNFSIDVSLALQSAPVSLRRVLIWNTVPAPVCPSVTMLSGTSADAAPRSTAQRCPSVGMPTPTGSVTTGGSPRTAAGSAPRRPRASRAPDVC